MNVTEIIKIRNSCRGYNNNPLTGEEKSELEKFIAENNTSIKGDRIDLKVIEKKPGMKEMRLNYGMITGHNTYIAGKSLKTQEARVNYGYDMEKVVLKATEMGLSTCWIGYFDKDYFEDLNVEPDYAIPGIVIVGHSDKKESLIEKLAKLSVNASKRQPWNKMLFDFLLKEPISLQSVNSYSETLEMLRLAPSSGNTQPWRIFFDKSSDEFHFYKKPINDRYEKDGLHDIDMGIAFAHFELAADFYGLKGMWISHPENVVSSTSVLQYILSWKWK